ncbi:MAG: AarF/UbiB family protein [Alphaproteobacteria bacterium]
MEYPLIIDELCSENPVLARLLSFFSCRIDLFDNNILNKLPSFKNTSLSETKENQLQITKSLKNLKNFAADNAFILWLLTENINKKPNKFNLRLLQATKYFLEKIDFETDLRFEAANACAIFDDFYSDDNFKAFDVDWIKTDYNVLVYEKQEELEPIKIKELDIDLIKTFYTIFFKMVFARGYFNFDFTKNNIALTKDHKFVLLDYSSVIKINTDERVILGEIFLKLLDSDYEGIIKLIETKNWGYFKGDSSFIGLMEKKTGLFDKLETLCKSSLNFDFYLPNEIFMVWLGLKNIRKLSSKLNVDEDDIYNQLKDILLKEKKSLFAHQKEKTTKYPEFKDKIKVGLQKKALLSSEKEKKKYFFQTDDEPKCRPRKKRVNSMLLWVTILIILYLFIKFRL